MKRSLYLALPIALTGCAHMDIDFGHGFGGSQAMKGNGKVQEVSRTVSEFDNIELGSAFHLEASEGPLSPIKISADSNLLGQIKTEVKNRTLKIWVDGSISTSSPQTISFTTPKINSLRASGAAEANLKLSSNHPFTLNASGASKVTVKGTVSSLDCELSGSSKVNFGNLALSRLDASLSGASNLTISGSTDALVADLSGASVIEGNLRGKQAKVTLSGASNASFGPFTSVSKDLSGSSSATFGK